MIRQEELASVAKLKGLSLRLAELDYLQDIALINLYREFGNRLVFKGGTCLYKLYRLDRFSEDLDFTATKGFGAKGFFQRLPYFFRLLDINSRVTVESFESATNVYLEVHGPLYDGKKGTVTTLKFNVSLRERGFFPVQRHSYSSIYHELRPFDVFAMDEKEILAEKVRAIYGRNKARDVYDFWHLIKRKGCPFELEFANRKLSYDRVKFDKDAFLAKVAEKKPSWEQDLSALVAGKLPPFAQVKKEIEESIQMDDPIRTGHR